MNIRTIALAATVALAALLLPGCVPAQSEQTSCQLAQDDPSRIICDGKSYAVLADTAPEEDLGAWKGTLHAIVAFDGDGHEVARADAPAGLPDLAALAEKAPDAVGTMSFAGVFESLGNEGELIVQVDGRSHRAVPDGELAEGATVLGLSPATIGNAGGGSFAIDPANAMRLVNDQAVYEIADDPVDGARIGVLLDAVPKSATFDAETLRPLTRDELLAPDWDGTQNQRRETIVYDGIWSLADVPVEEAVAVESDGAFLRAVRIRSDAL